MISSVLIPSRYVPVVERCGVPELALDQRQCDPFVQQLNGVRVAQLVRREPPPDPALSAT